MPQVTLPPPTNANERVFGDVPFCSSDEFVMNCCALEQCGWLFHDGKLYEPLRGLFAHDLNGNEVGVWEGSIVTDGLTFPRVGVVQERDWTWEIAYGDGTSILIKKTVEKGNDLIVLSHVKDLDPTNPTVPCFYCKGTGWEDTQIGEGCGMERDSCPTCSGAGRIAVKIGGKDGD